jgi:PilZ domain
MNVTIEHRRAKRLIMRVSMRVRALDRSFQKEETVTSMNISLRGVYFPTELKLQEGSDVEVRLKMPEEIIAGQATEWTFTARVVHLETLGGFNKKSGVGVHFLYYSAG